MKTKSLNLDILKSIFYFSIPFLLSYLLQTLYGMADLFIIGQFNDVSATTAVSIGSQVMHMITVMIVGLSMGSTIIIGKSVGAKNNEQKNIAIGNTVTLFFILSLIITVILITFINQIASLIATPKAAYSQTINYLTICFIGVPFITAYNIISSIFRGLGDSKHPMYFVATACVINILLDYIFIGLLGFGAIGAALGTTLSQLCSVVIALFYITKYKLINNIKTKHFSPDIHTLLSIIKIGIPVCIQDGFIQISFIIITIIANKRGLTDAAAVGIVEKLIGVFFLIPSSMLSTVSALCAQKNGAGEHKASRIILKYSICINIFCSSFIVVLMQFFSKEAISIFSNDAKVILLGSEYMRSYIFDCVLAGVHFCFSGFFCAYSLSYISFLHNFVSIVSARIPLAFLASIYYPHTLYPMGMAAPVGSVISILICIGFYIWFLHKRCHNHCT